MKLYKSKISHWWVGQSNLNLAFHNILDNDPFKNNLVVGYLGSRETISDKYKLCNKNNTRRNNDS